MKKQLDKLSEFLEEQFSDWSDIVFEYNEIVANNSGSISVTVEIEREDYNICFTEVFEVTHELHIYIGLNECQSEWADSKWFWIRIAPQLFPI